MGLLIRNGVIYGNGTPGTPGTDGKTAYEQAVEGGYQGTEQQFNYDMSHIPEKIAEETANWLEENVLPESEVVIDKSLTIEGAAADAKAIGDLKSDFVTAIKPITGCTPLFFERNHYYTTEAPGTLVTKADSENLCTIITPAIPGERFVMNVTGNTGIRRAWVFMDTNMVSISRAAPYLSGIIEAIAPPGAAYCAINNRVADQPSGYWAYAGGAMIAGTQIESGKYFTIGNTLYLSTTVIPAGDTIIPGTNCTQTDIAEALNALNT